MEHGLILPFFFLPIILQIKTSLIAWFLSHRNSHSLLIEKCLIACWLIWDQNKTPHIREAVIHITKSVRDFWDVTKLAIHKHNIYIYIYE